MSIRKLRGLAGGKQPDMGQDAPPPPLPPTSAEVIEETHREYETIQKELKEITILIKQSSSEVEKLAQHNAQLANKVRYMESNLDTTARQDIKELYTVAQEGQMRLFMMRGQVEQLQSRQKNLKRFSVQLRSILDISGSLVVASNDKASQQADAISKNDSETSGIVKIINAQEDERQYLATQLHDGPAQSLTNLILQAEICERFFDSDLSRARNELTDLKEAVTSTFQKVREFIFDLRPMMLDDLGLSPTLKKTAEDYERKTGIACNLTISGKDQRLPSHTEVTIFRVIQQLLKNVHAHAQATHAQITLNTSGDKVDVVVEDDGNGFDAEEAIIASQQRKTMGLSTIQERITMLGGEFNIDSTPGRGSKIDFWLPVV